MTSDGMLGEAPTLAPAWAYGLWLTTAVRHEVDLASVLAHVDEAAAWDLPVSGVHIDALGVSGEGLERARGLAEGVRARGLRVSVGVDENHQGALTADAEWLGRDVPGWFSHAEKLGGRSTSPDPVALKRSLAFGVLSSRALVEIPWALDEEAVEITRHFARLKNRLMPYLFASAAEAARANHTDGLRETGANPAEDAAGHRMLGPDLLVAPVRAHDGAVRFYMPDGVWTSLLTGEQVTGGRWVTETHSLDSIPLYVRPGAIIAWGSELERPDYDILGGLELDVFDGGPQGERDVRLVQPDGSPVVVTVTVQGARVTARLADGTEVAAQSV